MTTTDICASLLSQLQSTTSPWDRLPILTELARKMTANDPRHAHMHATEALRIAKELNDQFWIGVSKVTIGLTLSGIVPHSELLQYFQQASQVFAQINDPLMKARSDFRIAEIYIQTGRFAEAAQLLVECYAVFRKMKILGLLTGTLCLLGDVCKWIGEHGKAIEYYHRAIATGRKAGLTKEMGSIYTNLASLYAQMDDYEHERKYHFKSLAVHKRYPSQTGYAGVLSNIATMYVNRKEFAKAESYARRAMKLNRVLGHTCDEAIEWGKLGYIYAHIDTFSKAVAYFKMAFSLLSDSDSKITIGKLYETFGIICMQAGHRKAGLKHLKRSVVILRQTGYQLYQYESLKNLATAYEEVGDTTRALKHLKESTRIKEEYVNSRKSLEAGRAELRGSLLKLNAQLKEERSRVSSLKEEIEKKGAELVALTLGLVNREESQRSHPRKSISSGPSYNGNDDAFSESWEIFARQFHKVHQGFYGKLVAQFPELSLTEIKVCSLIRIGLSSKEIATILCISKRTVDSHREHIHKKLQLESGTLLANFIASI